MDAMIGLKSHKGSHRSVVDPRTTGPLVVKPEQPMALTVEDELL